MARRVGERPIRSSASGQSNAQAALADFENMILRKDAGCEGVIVSGRLATGGGFAAVECGLAQVNGNARPHVYAHVAPTEGNVQQAGPFTAWRPIWGHGSGTNRGRAPRRARRSLCRGGSDGRGSELMHEMSLTESVVEIALE